MENVRERDTHFDRFFDGVIDREDDEEHFTSQDEVIHRWDILEGRIESSLARAFPFTYTNQFDGGECFRGNSSAWRWEFHGQFDLTEQIDVGIVDGEIQEDHPSAAIEPEIAVQLTEFIARTVVVDREIVHITTTTVARDQPTARGAFQNIRALIHPSIRQSQRWIRSAQGMTYAVLV